MSEKLPLKKNFSFKKIWPTIQKVIIVLALILLVVFIVSLPNSTSIDFAILRRSLRNYGARPTDIKENDEKGKNISQRSASETIALKKLQQEREKNMSMKVELECS